MGEISRAALFGKLNSVAYKAIEAATVFCKLRGNPYVELAHWFHQLLQLQDSDLHRIIRQFNVESEPEMRALSDVAQSLGLPRTSARDTAERLLISGAVAAGVLSGDQSS